MPLSLRDCCSIQAPTGRWGVQAGVPTQAAGAVGWRAAVLWPLAWEGMHAWSNKCKHFCWVPLPHLPQYIINWCQGPCGPPYQWTGHLWLPVAHRLQPCLSQQTSRGWTPDVWVAPWRNLNATMSLSVDKKWYCWLIASKVLTNSSLVLKIQIW